MLNTHQIAILQANKAAGASSFDALSAADLPTNTYLGFLYDECWLDNPATLAKISQGFRASQSPEVAIGPYYHSALAERLPRTRELLAQGVPFIGEFADFLLAIERRNCGRPSAWLGFLTRQIHLAAAEDLDFFFAEMANTLQNQLVIRTENASFRITELEFYYHGRNHPDPYVHKGAEQLKPLHWYFNQATSLDLTFGDTDTDSYGGILLRGLKELDAADRDKQAATFPYTVGPQLTLRALVASWGSALNGAAYLGLQDNPAPFEPSATAWRTARVGLNSKTEAAGVANPYHARRYRFLADKDYLKRLPYKENICRELALDPATTREVLGYSPAWL